MSYFVSFLITLYAQFATGVENQQDAVHAKVASKVYFTSDFIDLQTAIYIRNCEEKKLGLPFWRLVKDFFPDKQAKIKLSDESLLDEKLSYKKAEFEALILVIKLVQILVEQQVSIQKSQNVSYKEDCLPMGKKLSLKTKEWHSKLIFLDDLLVSKANIEKDESKKQIALKSILDSLHKQVKHEALVELK